MRNFIYVGWLLIIFICIQSGLASQENPQPPPPKEITLKTETHWLEEKKQEVILVDGKTNLPPATVLKIELRAGITIPNKPDNTQLVDIAQTGVNNDNQFSLRFSDFKTTFSPEYYEIVVSIWPDQPKEGLLAEGFSEESLNQAKDYQLVNIFSPVLSQRRQQSVEYLIKLIEQTLQLDTELMEKISRIEKIKQGEREIDEMIKRLFQVYQKKEEILDELSKDWLTWEKEWTQKFNTVLRQIKEEKLCLGASADIHAIISQVPDYYRKYRKASLDEEGKLKDVLLLTYLADPLKTPEETKRQLLEYLEKELTVKIRRDITARLGEIVATFNQCLEDSQKANETWANYKNSLTDYLTALNKELESYSRAGLYLSAPSEKEKMKNIYNQMTELIESTRVLVEKFGLRLVDPANQKLETETLQLIDLINKKSKSLLTQ